MKKLIFNIFKKIFDKQIKKEVCQELNLWKKNHFNEEWEKRNQIEKIELEMYVGKPVIYVSNEWANPIIGFGKEVIEITKAKTPTLIVHDYISGEDRMILGKVYHYTEQRFNAFSKLTPFEACSLLYPQFNWNTTFNKVKSGNFDGYDVLRKKLEVTDFFTKVEEMMYNDSIENIE